MAAFFCKRITMAAELETSPDRNAWVCWSVEGRINSRQVNPDHVLWAPSADASGCMLEKLHNAASAVLTRGAAAVGSLLAARRRIIAKLKQFITCWWLQIEY